MAHATFTSRTVTTPQAEPPSAGAMFRGFVLVLIVPALVFAGVFAYGKYEHFSAAAKAPGQPGALVWSDGKVIFSNRNQVAAWLRQRGGTFQGFKKNHPAAVQLVSTRRIAVTHTKIAAGTRTPVKAPAKTPTHVEAVAPTPGASGGSGTRTSVYALSGVALLFLLLACAPVALLWRVPLLRTLRVPELRLLFGGAGAAIAAGLAVSLLLS